MAEEKQDIVFAQGLVFNQPSERTPNFILGSLWVKVDEFKDWLDTHNTNNGGVNIDIKMSKKGVPYCSLSTFKPTKPKTVEEVEQVIPQDEEDLSENTPF